MSNRYFCECPRISVTRTPLTVVPHGMAMRWSLPALLLVISMSAGAQEQVHKSASQNGPAETPDAQVVPSTESSASVSRFDRAMNWLLRSQRQRRADMLERRDFDALTEVTGNQHWQAEAQYRNADFEQAADQFAALSEADESALYNQATALARAGQLDESLDLYNEILDRRPEHADALHNRDIVEQLKEQAQQQGQGGQQLNSDDENRSEADQQEDGQDSADDDAGQQQDQNQQQEQSGDQQSGDQQSGDQQEGDQQNAGEQGQQDPQDAQQESVDLDTLSQNGQLTEQQQEMREQIEKQALEELATTEPLSEQQQATEQWLRQIPDDPSGLLRRKLQQTHSTDYPQIRNSSQPW